MRAVQVFVGGHWRQKVACVGQAVRANWSPVWQTKGRAKILANIAPRLGFKQLQPKANAPWNNHNFLRFSINHAQFSHKALAPPLQHQQ